MGVVKKIIIHTNYGIVVGCTNDKGEYYERAATRDEIEEAMRQ